MHFTHVLIATSPTFGKSYGTKGESSRYLKQVLGTKGESSHYLEQVLGTKGESSHYLEQVLGTKGESPVTVNKSSVPKRNPQLP